MNLQFNLLKLLAQNAQPSSGGSSPESNQLHLLSALSNLNQGGATNPQLSKLRNSYLGNLIQNRVPQRALMEAELTPEEIPRQQLFAKQDPLVLVPPTDGSGSMSSIPSFGTQSLQFHSHDTDSDGSVQGLSAKSKKIKKMNVCGHPERAHYAKNMCNQCYHKHGRTKKPWRCSHDKLYAHGLCQNCYINAYNKKRNQKTKEPNSESKSSWNEGETDYPGSANSALSSADEPLTVEDKAAFADFQKEAKIEPSEVKKEGQQ